ncbi:MAG: DnaJ domain-containing protein [Cyanobacteriota bacterium]|nr:DnaJ domain-containing protein [Cyanobacteriota bacterium]
MVDQPTHASETYYEQLGLAASASPEQIKDAYRQLALQVHPDKLPADTSARLRSLAKLEFLKLQRAYHTLMDPERRQAYDRSLSSPAEPLAFHASPAYSSPLLAETDSRGVGWPMLLVSGLAGITVTLLALASLNWFAGQRSIAVSKAEGDPTPSLATAPPPEQAAIAAESAQADLMVPPAAPTPTLPSPEQIDRFVRAVYAVQPLLAKTDEQLKQATSPAERQRVEQEFEVVANRLIAANGLTTVEYQRISQQMRQDPLIQKAVTDAAARLNL